MIAREFAVAWEHVGDLLDGAALTVVLSLAAGAFSLLIGCGLTMLLMSRHRLLASILRGFIELMRCTPWMPAICCSIGSVIRLSITSAEAPA